MIFYLPLEHIDMRYTTHMDRDIEAHLNESGKEYVKINPIINGIDSKPPVGQFLNSAFTTAYKSMQIAKLAEYFYSGEITSEDTIFISDLWFPGIESIEYMKYFTGIKPKIRGNLYAGSFTDTDFVRDMERWAKNFEDIIFDITDKVFVISQFMKDDLLKKRFVHSDKLVVTGLPLDFDNLDKYTNTNERENIVIFNGRLCDEKQPFLFDRLKEEFGDDVQFIKTQELNLSKTEYYELLSRSKAVVSYALQENFGYGIQEAVYLGCVPIVPDRLAYVEQFDVKYRFKTFDESVVQLKKVFKGELLPCKIWDKSTLECITTWFKGA